MISFKDYIKENVSQYGDIFKVNEVSLFKGKYLKKSGYPSKVYSFYYTHPLDKEAGSDSYYNVSLKFIKRPKSIKEPSHILSDIDLKQLNNESSLNKNYYNNKTLHSNNFLEFYKKVINTLSHIIEISIDKYPDIMYISFYETNSLKRFVFDVLNQYEDVSMNLDSSSVTSFFRNVGKNLHLNYNRYVDSMDGTSIDRDDETYKNLSGKGGGDFSSFTSKVSDIKFVYHRILNT